MNNLQLSLRLLFFLGLCGLSFPALHFSVCLRNVFGDTYLEPNIIQVHSRALVVLDTSELPRQPDLREQLLLTVSWQFQTLRFDQPAPASQPRYRIVSREKFPFSFCFNACLFDFPL